MSKKYLSEFSNFLERELHPATLELEKIKVAASRKHLQKLVYTNLVDRFDYCVDKTLLDLVEDDDFQNEIIERHNTPINASEVFKLFLKTDSPRENVLEILRENVRVTVLRKRHSQKVIKLLEVLGVETKVFKKPRVNPSTGKIISSIKPLKKIPVTIEGYADWLYSRRNAIVHGGGSSKILENDIKQLEKRFNCTPAKSVKLTVGSIKIAGKFYQDLISIISD